MIRLKAVLPRSPVESSNIKNFLLCPYVLKYSYEACSFHKLLQLALLRWPWVLFLSASTFSLLYHCVQGKKPTLGAAHYFFVCKRELRGVVDEAPREKTIAFYFKNVSFLMGLWSQGKKTLLSWTKYYAPKLRTGGNVKFVCGYRGAFYNFSDSSVAILLKIQRYQTELSIELFRYLLLHPIWLVFRTHALLSLLDSIKHTVQVILS